MERERERIKAFLSVFGVSYSNSGSFSVKFPATRET